MHNKETKKLQSQEANLVEDSSPVGSIKDMIVNIEIPWSN